MSLRPRRLPALLLATTVLLAACGDDDDGASPTVDPSTTTTTADGAASTTTTTATTTSRAPSTSTTAAPTTAPSGPKTVPTSAPGAPALPSGQPVGRADSGSGCAPGPGALPDGDWYGLVSSATATGLQFDLACWFTGEAATRAAAEDGAESPPPNDYYVRNDNPLLRPLTLASPDIPVRWTASSGDPSTERETPYPQWLSGRSGGFPFGVWVEVRSGQVQRITEQWVP